MAPLTPHWAQPSHPEIQKVLINNEKEFTTKSISLVDLPPYALFAKLAFPPCTSAEKPTYATVQMGKEEHLNLNSDLVYINHSCEPSVIFDTTSLSILAGPAGLKANEELTFFYPSTEWDMAQGFDCFCGAASCRRFIAGAKNMKPKQLEGIWLNAHIRALLEERDDDLTNGDKSAVSGNGTTANGSTAPSSEQLSQGPTSVSGNGTSGDATEEALKASLEQAKKMVDAAQKALKTYQSIHGGNGNGESKKGGAVRNGVGSRELSGEMGGDTRRGVTGRELAGEMGGDTQVA